MNNSSIVRSAFCSATLALVVGCSSAAPTPTIVPSVKPPATTPGPTAKPPTPSPAPSPTASSSPTAQPPSPSAPASSNAIAVFDVGGQTFRIELIGKENLRHARALLAGTGDAPIPNGLLVRGDAGVNAPWSWHIDPSTLEWADMTTEVCDGTPSQIEDGTFTYERFCPWSAQLTALAGAP
jgi:hypothetical protein